MKSDKSSQFLYLKCVKTLPKQIHTYLTDVGSLVSKYIGFQNVYSILIFGSYANREYTKNSDCDFMIILKDSYYQSMLRKDFRLLDSVFLSMEIKNNLKFKRGNIIDGILTVVEKSTGMFTSHFICSKESWENQSFFKIFKVNPLLSIFLAPSSIVLSNMTQLIKILYGKQPKIIKKKKINSFQLIKSLIMTECIALGAIAIYPIWNDSIKYSLESLKWAYKNSHQCLLNKYSPLKSIVLLFSNKRIKNAINQQDYKRFMQLRISFMKDIRFAIKTPLLILKIHLIALIYMKI